MKKLISIILSLALVACMFGMSAMAADLGDETTGKVGTHGTRKDTADSHLDGVESFDATDFSKNVMLKLDPVQSRYAVDIVFDGTFNLTAAGLTWDVNELAYVTTGATVTDQTYTFVVTNYSDKNVNVTTAASDVVSGVTATFTGTAAGDVEDGANATSCQIKGNANTTDGEANKATFSATLASTTTWSETINTLVGTNPAATSFKLATFTVTVSKAPVTP